MTVYSNHNKNNLDTIFYDVRAGDSLSSIIKTYYGKVSLQQQKKIIENIMLENTEVKNPNIIHPGQTLVIDIPQQYNAMPGFPAPPVIQGNKQVIKTLKNNLQTATPPEKKLMSALAPIMLGTGATGLTMINQTFKSNAPLLGEMAENYNNYKADKMTRGQYDYQRRSLLNRLKSKLGPTNLLLNGSKPPNEILRISRTKGNVPTHIINNQAKQMRSLSKLASRGGVVLSVAGLGVACHQIASTNDKQQKNEILVESLGGVIGGAAYGAIVTVLLIGTPIGWVAALAIGVGSVAVSYGVGAGLKNLYTTRGTHIDFSSLSKVNELCQ